MNGPGLPRRLHEGRPLIGTLVTLDSPEVAETLALGGIEWLFIDTEHAPTLDARAVQRIAQAVAGRCYTVARVPVNEEAWIKKVLDAGADGVIVPHVRGAEDARRAVWSAKYPPAGGRSVGIARAQGYGLDFAGYLHRANATTALVLQIEDVEGVQNVAEILAVPGVDALLIGPYDLSGSMGRLGDVAGPEVRAAVDKVRASCQSVGMPLGIYAPTAQAARTEISSGIRFVAVGTDLGLMSGAARQAKAEVIG
jgi:2-keto-3-deoxy-L-rhamnonate aldolase RhmA